MVVASIDFRLAPEHAYPALVQDANYAVRWLKAHAGDFGGDGSAVGALGRSSGGHSVLLNGLRPNDRSFITIPLPEAPDTDATVAYLLTLWPVVDSHARYLIARERGVTHLVQASEGYFPDRGGDARGQSAGGARPW
jgi:acetyl esterase/lipase